MRFYLVQAHPDRGPEPYSDAEGFAHFGAAWPEVRGEELAPDGSGRTLAEVAPLRTFWLYWGSRVLTAVRMPEDSTDADVRSHAIENEERVPIGHLRHETPAEFRGRLARAVVRTFADETTQADAAGGR